jgi:hypothetical protein
MSPWRDDDSVREGSRECRENVKGLGNCKQQIPPGYRRAFLESPDRRVPTHTQ